MSDNRKTDDGSADVDVQRLARIYAKALLNAADKAGQTGEVLAELDMLIDQVFAADDRVEVLFSSAAVGRRTRHAVIEKAFAGQASATLYHFLLVLNDHERLDLLRSIRHAAHELDDERHNRVKVFVWSAVPVPDDLKGTITDAVRRRFELEPVLDLRVDPKLLGGLKVRIGDRQLDATVRTRLDNLRNEILARSSHAVQSQRDRFSSD